MVVSTNSHFITGGVRSGKSAFAEQLVRQTAQQTNRKMYYIASGVAFDDEMKQRIAWHQADRTSLKWTTIEQPTHFATLVNRIPKDAVVLWDCVTTWLTNEMYVQLDDKSMQWQHAERFQQRVEEAKEWCRHLNEQHIPFFIVSNEVLDESKYESEEVEFYRKQIGLFHQWLVSFCAVAIEMDYGIPHYWKGGK